MEKKVNWKTAELALCRCIAELLLQDRAECNLKVRLKLEPLLRRFNAGERSEDLYIDIMEVTK